MRNATNMDATPRLAAYEIFSLVLSRIDQNDPAWDEIADGLDALIGDCGYKRPDGSYGRLTYWRPDAE